METIEEIKAQMRTWTDANLEAEAKECRKVFIHPHATKKDKEEAKLSLRAIKEIKEERVQMAEARQKWEELQEGARLARIELAKEAALAEMRSQRSTQKPQQTQDERQAGLHPMEGEAFNNLAKWYTTMRANEFEYAINDIYDAIDKGEESDKDICRRIYKIYGRINARRYTDKGMPIKRPSWKVFCEAMAAGYGVQLPYYRPVQLK